MNPQANEWKPSAAAAAWTPGQGFQVSAPAPAPAPPAQTNSDESEVDENDPLWKIVLKIAEGDREKAIQMINEPDSLSQYPEVEAVLAGDSAPMDTSGGDGGTDNLAKEVDEKMAIAETPPGAPAAVSSPANEAEEVEDDEDEFPF